MKVEGIIYDFDGVIADSEILANVVLAEVITKLGLNMSWADALDRFMGRRWPEIIGIIECSMGCEIPEDFSGELETTILRRFSEELLEVKGASNFIRKFSRYKHCIASSSSLKRLNMCLEFLGLTKEFEGQVLSGDMVQNGKPAPNLYPLAARHIDVPPSQCVVIEDSIEGVRAGVAAGSTVIGLAAGSHTRPRHCEKLALAGASFTAKSWMEVKHIVNALR